MFLEEKNLNAAVKAPVAPTFAGFLAFCESKDLDERYEYMAVGNCAFAQYLHAIGFLTARCGGDYWREGIEDQARHALPFPPTVLCGTPTFGALAERLHAL